MVVEDMHYDFKKKLNKGDSQQYKNLQIPEIDWTLNEAAELFVKLIAQPRYRSLLGLETSQRTIDDIRTIITTRNIENINTQNIVGDTTLSSTIITNISDAHNALIYTGQVLTGTGIPTGTKVLYKNNEGSNANSIVMEVVATATTIDLPIVINNENIISLPTDYWIYADSSATINKETCLNASGEVIIRQHDDNYELSPFDKSSFEWRTVNGVFESRGLKLFTDGTFTISALNLTYIQKMPYICNAENYGTSGYYNLPSGVVLDVNQNCVLPEQTHREIVDLAVLIASGELQDYGYQFKQEKIVLNNLK